MAGLETQWYKNGTLQLILLPASWLFRILMSLRRALYRSHILKSYRLPVPVIVIGNISVGGTGKTPLTLAIAQQFIEQGYHPIILSRGFGGTTEQQQVSCKHTAAAVGDEPLLMAQRGICPVWVGRDRVATGLLALRAYPQCDVLLCDDGLQHYRLRRDVEIVVVDGVRRFGNTHLLPAGPLREPLTRLRTVDAIVINGGNITLRQNISVTQYAMQLSGTLFYNLKHPEKTASASDFRDLRLHAAAGIGHPQRFFDYLTTLGLSITTHAFPDHHSYLACDLQFDACDILVITEKDAVKCTSFADDKFWVLRVDARIDSALIAHLIRKVPLHGC